MPRFSRNTIIELVEALGFQYHNQMDEFLFRFEIEQADREGGLAPRKMGIKRYLADNADQLGSSGANLIVEILEFLIEQRLKPSAAYYGRDPKDSFPNLVHSLARDGFTIEDGRLRSTLPEIVAIPEKENQLMALLGQFSFNIAKGHLQQAISAHTRGEWASANAQLRSFVESLFDAIAKVLLDPTVLRATSHGRRELLSQIDPPFILPVLNEWIPNGPGFVQGFWKRLHPQGSHPGLSDEEDCTFRLQLVMLVASHYMRRLASRA